MEKKDWIMHQVEGMSFSLAKFILNKDKPNNEVLFASEEIECQLLHEQLTALLDKGKINEAENLLFEAISSYDSRYFQIALDFYAQLDKYDDEYLAQCHFPRAEIIDGLNEVRRLFTLDQ
ncbi:hypothetical protein SAMN04488134_108112 [Amphibacillus marinus]|uniref:Uncharacterized protein n=1 Tax=Amphibacillus marinus TaxID=872970 RepID=A0A1H8QCI9_9BACI|nr:DUF6483 family protein [Amphibacillus marinus]SEO51634.1 hypothetical protein SAMN04488134_108112 [Amphibacillus marinus]